MKKIALILSIVMVIGLIYGCSSTNGSSQKEAKVESDNLPEDVNIGLFSELSPYLILEEEDKWEEYLGTKVNLFQFDTSAEMNQAMASGSIDIAVIGSTGAAIGIATDLGYEAIWVSYVIGSAEALIAKGDSGIDSVTDLVGKKVAVPFAGTTHYCLLGAFQKEGIDPSEVELIDMKTADILAAWKRNDIDATYIWYPVLGELIADNGKILVTSADMMNEGIVTSDVFVINKDVSSKYPQLAKNFVESQKYAIDRYNSDYDTAISEMSNMLGMDIEEAKQLSEGYYYPTAEDQITSSYLGKMEIEGEYAEGLHKTAEFLKQQGSIKNVPDISAFYSAVNGNYVDAILSGN